MVEVSWYDEEQTVLVITMPQRWVVDELLDAIDQGNGLIDSTTHDDPIYVISDNRESAGPPVQILGRLQDIADSIHPRAVFHCMLRSRTSHYERTIANLFSRVFTKVEMFDELEEALARIERLKAD